MRNLQLLALATVTSVALTTKSQASLFISDNFNTFANGDLVGQNGWVQQGAASTLPLQVSGGTVLIPPGQIVDNQDAAKFFSTPFLPPASGSASLFVGMQLNLTLAPAANSSYFLALHDGGSFANFRVAARDDGAGGFLLGGRVNGQTGYPFTFGTVGLSYNTFHTVIVQAELIAGNANDVIRIYVDPTSSDLASQTPYVTSTYNTGTVADPTQLASVLISQFGSGTVANVGAEIKSVAAGDNFSEVFVATIPEPSSGALIVTGLVALGFLRRRQG